MKWFIAFVITAIFLGFLMLFLYRIGARPGQRAHEDRKPRPGLSPVQQILRSTATEPPEQAHRGPGQGGDRGRSRVESIASSAWLIRVDW